MRAAFSLVELSIVLVILGLLTGGILTGQNLIRAAELRSVSTEFQTYQAAVNTFRDKYFALPGDMPNATDFWGAAGCPATAGSGTETCSGNGDGVINAAPAASNYGEHYTFWQHLANAGLIEGNYTGMAGGGALTHHVIGENSPRGKLGNSGWNADTEDSAGSGMTFAYDYGNTLMYGAPAANWWAHGKLLVPEEAWNIDTKMDDGKPGTGSIIAAYWNTCTDAPSNGSGNQNDRISAQYDLSVTGAECAFYFADAF